MGQHSPAIMDCAEAPDSRHPAPGKCRQTLDLRLRLRKQINALAFNSNIRDAMAKKIACYVGRCIRPLRHIQSNCSWVLHTEHFAVRRQSSNHGMMWRIETTASFNLALFWNSFTPSLNVAVKREHDCVRNSDANLSDSKACFAREGRDGRSGMTGAVGIVFLKGHKKLGIVRGRRVAYWVDCLCTIEYFVCACACAAATRQRGREVVGMETETWDAFMATTACKATWGGTDYTLPLPKAIFLYSLDWGCLVGPLIFF